MKPTQTGIAVALALAVVVLFFILPGLSPFGSPAPSNGTVTEATTTTATNAQTASTTMPTDTTNQLQIIDESVGTGAAAAAGDTVTVNYVGAFTNGTVFDASANHPETKNGFTFTLGAGQVIAGWDEGIVGMKVGGKRKLIVPPALGYGSQDYGPIPGNSTLVFEVELLKVQKAGK